jgi:hypothetical protein
MNWKWGVAVALGLLLGLSLTLFQRKTVMASPVPVSTHFELQPATVEESNGQGQRVPVHEVFLLDTESGKVWQFQAAATVFDQSKGQATPIGPKFSSVPVESGQ